MVKACKWLLWGLTEGAYPLACSVDGPASTPNQLLLTCHNSISPSKAQLPRVGYRWGQCGQTDPRLAFPFLGRHSRTKDQGAFDEKRKKVNSGGSTGEKTEENRYSQKTGRWKGHDQNTGNLRFLIRSGSG